MLAPVAVSAPAARVLAAGGGRARVSSLFAHSLNLSCGGWVVNVATSPLASVCSMQVGREGGEDLRAAGIGAPVRVDTTDSRVQPMPGPVTAGDVQVGTATVAPAVVEEGVLDLVSRGARGSWFTPGQDSGIGCERLRDAARTLAGSRSASRAPGGVLRPLVGLGVGLTPSGDDAAVAMLCVMRSWGAGPWPGDPLGAELASGVALTTDVSSTALRLALGGEFSPDLVAVVSHLDGGLVALRGGGLGGAVAALRDHGATSGRDALAGVAALLCARSLHDRHHPEGHHTPCAQS